MHELADAVHDLHLVRLQVTDEVPAKGIAVDGVLALEVLRAVLADDPDTRLDEDAMSSSGTYFVAATIVTPSPAASRTCSNAALIDSGVIARAPRGRARADTRARSGSARRPRRRRAGCSTRPSSGPSSKPRVIRSVPSTARSPIRCSLPAPPRVPARSARGTLELVRAHIVLAATSASLLVDELEVRARRRDAARNRLAGLPAMGLRCERRARGRSPPPVGGAGSGTASLWRTSPAS